MARQYAAWCAAHHSAAQRIQAGGRGFLARCRARVAREVNAWELCGVPALLSIQRTVRGFLVRRAYARRLEEVIRVKVIVPAAGVLQKCWRGTRGRIEAARQRLSRASATEIQARYADQIDSSRVTLRQVLPKQGHSRERSIDLSPRRDLSPSVSLTREH